MNSIIQQDLDQILQASIPWENLAGATVLITGATSMLGSYMVYTLAQLQRKKPQYKIQLVLGIRSPEKARRLFGPILDRPDIHLWVADMGGLFQYDGRVDYIVHAASLASSHLFLTNPVEVALPNVIGTWQLLEIAKREKVRGFLFFSSGAVYGKLENLTEVCEYHDGHLLPMDVRSCYGESKRMGENLCACYGAQYGIPAFSVRIPHTYGPTMDLNDSRVFCEFVKNVVDDENIIMKSDGSARRPFCYLSDATIAFFLLLLKGQAGVAYNMCNNDGNISILELAHLLCELFPEKKLTVIKQARSTSDTYSEDKTAGCTLVNCNQLHGLGWYPKVGLKEGFKRTVISFMEDKAAGGPPVV